LSLTLVTRGGWAYDRESTNVDQPGCKRNMVHTVGMLIIKIMGYTVYQTNGFYYKHTNYTAN
jgi:hypothetical protein